MKNSKFVFAAILVIFSVSIVNGYDSGIALVTEKGMNMQVFVNGKLYNKNPGKFVRIRSSAGLFHVEVRVLNPRDRMWHRVRKDLRAEKGFELQYRVVFVNFKPQLIEEQKHPIYSKYFLNPTLYNKHFVS